MCQSRLEVLFQHRGQLTLSLLDLLIRSTLINSTASNDEMKCLRAELSDKVFCVLSELLKAAQQLRWYRDIGRHVGLTWLVESINSTEVIDKLLVFVVRCMHCLCVDERQGYDSEGSDWSLFFTDEGPWRPGPQQCGCHVPHDTHTKSSVSKLSQIQDILPYRTYG